MCRLNLPSSCATSYSIHTYNHYHSVRVLGSKRAHLCYFCALCAIFFGICALCAHLCYFLSVFLNFFDTINNKVFHNFFMFVCSIVFFKIVLHSGIITKFTKIHFISYIYFTNIFFYNFSLKRATFFFFVWEILITLCDFCRKNKTIISYLCEF